jgi:acyl carrier protein
MTRQEAEAEVLRVISTDFLYRETTVEQLNLTDKLYEDLGFDSLEEVELCMTLERDLLISIEEFEISLWSTIEDVVNSVMQALEAED